MPRRRTYAAHVTPTQTTERQKHPECRSGRLGGSGVGGVQNDVDADATQRADRACDADQCALIARSLAAVSAELPSSASDLAAKKDGIIL